MAESSEGWDGTVDEAGIARIIDSAVPGHVKNPGDFSATAVAGQRRVLLTPGESHQAFIRYVDTSPRTIDFAAPTAGRWHLLVQRRDWDANTVTTRALAGPTTTAVVPQTPPDALPADFKSTPGVVADLPLWWAWVSNADNAVLLRDAREYDFTRSRLDALRFEGRTRRSDGQMIMNAGETLLKWQTIAANTLEATATSNGLGAALVLPAGGIYVVTATLKLQCGAQNWSYLKMPISGGIVLASTEAEVQSPAGFYQLGLTRHIQALDQLTVNIQLQSNNAGAIREDGYVQAFRLR